MKKDNRGGARPGSGAPKKDAMEKCHRTSVQIPAWMISVLDDMAGRSGKTRSAVIVEILKIMIKKEDVNADNV